jgi:diacyltrehalose acyltransferase
MVSLPVKKHRVNRVSKGLAVVAALPLVAVPTAGAATVPATVPDLPSPATVLVLSPVPGSALDDLQGSLCELPNNCVPVDYPPFITSAGVAALELAIDETIAASPDTDIIVFGYSNGAIVTAQWLAEHADDPDAPSDEQLFFVVIGNSTRAFGGLDARSGQVMPQTQYQVIDVARQYDGAADFPDDPFNLLALANALAGFTFIHTDYEGVNINDPANAVWTVDTNPNTTYVLVPTENLPLLEPLRILGLTALADSLNGPLKEIVEQAYNRPVPFPTTAQSAPEAITTAASALSASVVSDPTVAPSDATVPLSLAPTPPGDSAPTSTGPKKVNGNDKGPAVADTVTTTTPPGPADVLDTVKTNTPPAAQTDLDNATAAAKQSTTAPTTRTTATSTTNGNKVVPGKAGGNKATTNSGDQATKEGDQATSTKHSEKAANSDG